MFAAAGVETIKIPPRAPRANAYAKRWVRTVRTECLGWTLIWNRQHLHRVLTAYLEHDNNCGRSPSLRLPGLPGGAPATDVDTWLLNGAARPHRGIDLDVPVPAPIATVTTLPAAGRVERVDVLGGLIHEYHRAA